jgi:hypothetical protein
MELEQFEEAVRKDDFAVGDSFWLGNWEFEVVNRRSVGERTEEKTKESASCIGITGVEEKMKSIVTIKGQPIIEVYESFDGSHWFVTEKAWKQDSLIGRKIYKNDQILFGYVRLSSCPECAEFGYFSEAELRRLGWKVWKVDKRNWSVCPGVDVEEVPEEAGSVEACGCGICVPQPASSQALREEGQR